MTVPAEVSCLCGREPTAEYDITGPNGHVFGRVWLCDENHGNDIVLCFEDEGQTIARYGADDGVVVPVNDPECSDCGARKSEHYTWNLNEDTIEDVCPGQVEDIDTFQGEDA